ncbi:MAG: FUSC family protein [Caulobacteraceae bacterium]
MTARLARPAFQTRQAARLSSWSVSFAPEAASMSEGLRAAAACAAVAALAVLTHRNALSWAAVSAFWTCLVDPGGSTLVRAKVMGAYCVVASLLAVACAWAASQGGAAPIVLLFLLILAGGYIRVYGSEVALLANLLNITVAVVVTRPIAAGDVLTYGLIFFGGSLWALLLSLTVWRIHPYAPARRALRLAQEELAAMAMALSNLAGSPAGDAAWVAHAQQHRRAVREAVEAARRVIGQAAAGRGGMGSIAAELTSALNTAEGEFACMIALTDTLERQGPGDETARRRTSYALKRLAAVFHRVGRNAEAMGGDAPALERSIAHLSRAIDQLSEPVGRLMRDGLLQAQRLLERRDPALPSLDGSGKVAKPLLQQVMGPLRDNFRWSSSNLRHGLRLATSVTAAFLLTRAFHIPYGYWMTMTVVIIQQPYMATTWTRALERVIGSVAGGALAALLGIVFHSQLALLALIFPLAIACMAFRPVNYTIFVFFLTPLFVLMLDLTHPGQREVTLAGTRALNTVMGGLIALVGGVVLWPSSGLNRLREDLAEAVAANGRFAALACDPAGQDASTLDAARRAAGLASNKAEASQHRAVLETWWRRKDIEAAAAVLAVLRRVAGTATTLWLERDRLRPDQSAVAAWCEQATTALAGALRNLSPPPSLAPAAAADRRHPLVEEVLDLYSAARTLAVAEAPKRRPWLQVRTGGTE